jgi:hypothetical protein
MLRVGTLYISLILHTLWRSGNKHKKHHGDGEYVWYLIYFYKFEFVWINDNGNTAPLRHST